MYVYICIYVYIYVYVCTAGIMMLNTSDIRKLERDALASALTKGCFQLKQALSLHVPATPAVWALSSADSISKRKSGVLTDAADALQQVMQGAMQDMGTSLFAAFDLTLAVDHESLMTDSFMSTITDRQASSHAACRHQPGGASSTCSRASNKRKVARQQVKRHCGKAASLPMPCVCADAMKMIQHYYALLRQQSATQGPTGTAVGTHTVASLLRMATASARLHMRNDAMAMPDAVLSIYMLQESLKAKVCHTRAGKRLQEYGAAQLHGTHYVAAGRVQAEVCMFVIQIPWHFLRRLVALSLGSLCTAWKCSCMQGMSIVQQLDVTPGTASCIQDAALTIETKLQDMYDFLSSYLLTTTEE